MRNLKITIIALISSLLIVSCYDDEGVFDFEKESIVEQLSAEKALEDVNDLRKNPTIIFGRYYQGCYGNSCVEIFRVADDQLKEDVLDNIPTLDKRYTGKFVSFKGSDQIDIQNIVSLFPVELFNSNSNSGSIGWSEDTRSVSKMYIEYEDPKGYKQWIIDLNDERLPDYLLRYILEVSKIIENVGEFNNEH